jgi:transcription initiation factor IIE alpha subunit
MFEPEEKNEYVNHYYCERCNLNWEDESPSMNNDRCPNCNTETEPYKSTPKYINDKDENIRNIARERLENRE